MSNDLRNAVWVNGPADPTQRFVLLSLCDRADDDGYCWPSHNDTAKRTGFGRRAVINAMSRLAAGGWITTEVRYKTGRERSSNGIYINCQRLLGGELDSLGSERRSPRGELDSPPNGVLVVNDVHRVVNDVHQGGERRAPKSFIESVIEPEEEEEAPHSTPQEPVAALRDHFRQRTAIEPNDRTGTYERDWLTPLGRFLELTNGDVAAACVLIDRALAVAWGDNERRKTYTVSCPRSIVGIAVNLAAARQVATVAADDDTIWQRAVAAVTRREFTDERLKAAIRAIGGTGRIASANGHDTDALKRSLGHAYRNVATA